MAKILLVADGAWVRNEVRSALSLPGYVIDEEADPQAVPARVANGGFDAAIVDLQVGSMGGMAIVRALKEQAVLAGLESLPVILLLDRRADTFLARRAAADAWVLKPFTPHELRSALDGVVSEAPSRTG